MWMWLYLSVSIYYYIYLYTRPMTSTGLDLLPSCLPAGHMKIHICPRIGNYSLFKELNIILFVKFSWKRYIYIIFWLHNIRLLSFWKRYNVVKSTVWSDLHKCLFLVTLGWISRYYFPDLISRSNPCISHYLRVKGKCRTRFPYIHFLPMSYKIPY